MIAMDDDVASILTSWHREQSKPVGEATEAAGLRLIKPPLYQGENDTPEGPFYERHESGLVLPAPAAGDGSRKPARTLRRRVKLHGWSLIALWFLFLVFAIVVTHAWRPGWP